MHLALNIFVLFAILGAGWIAFFAWLIGTIVRVVWNGVARVSGVAPRRRPVVFAQTRCRRVRCRAMNPPQANFCRRCGSPLTYPAMKHGTCQPARDENWASNPVSL